MSLRYPNTAVAVIYKEPAYAAEISDYSAQEPLILADTLTPPQAEIEIIETGRHTYTRQPDITQFAQGRSVVNLTLSGSLSAGHSPLLSAFFTVEDFPYAFSEERLPYSYQIHLLFGDGKASIAYGCVMEQLKIKGESGEAITYEASFRASKHQHEIDTSTLNGHPGYHYLMIRAAQDKPFLFSDTTIHNLLGSNLSGYTSANSLELTLTNNFVDDNGLYNNSRHKQREIISGSSGEIELEVNYDSDKPVREEDLVTTSRGKAAFSFTDGTVIWTIANFGMVTKATLPDPENDIYKLKATFKLARQQLGTNCISITCREE